MSEQPLTPGPWGEGLYHAQDERLKEEVSRSMSKTRGGQVRWGPVPGVWARG